MGTHRRRSSWPLRRLVGLVLGAGLVAVGLALAGAAAGQEASPAGDPATLELGATRFAANCARCHGERGEGFIGPTIAGTQVQLDRVLKLVREPEGMMASFRPDVLPDADVAAIYAFLRALGGEPAAPAPEAPAGDAVLAAPEAAEPVGDDVSAAIPEAAEPVAGDVSPVAPEEADRPARDHACDCEAEAPPEGAPADAALDAAEPPAGGS